MKKDWASEAGMLGASLVGAFAVAGLAQGATAAAAATAGVGALVVAVFQRRLVFAVLTSVVVVALSSLWWAIGAETRFGLPTPTTIRSLRHSLQAAHPLLVGFHLPLAHSPGIVILCALISGLAAVGARAVGTRYPALSLAPPAAILICSAILLPRTEAGVAGLALGVCGFLVLPRSEEH